MADHSPCGSNTLGIIELEATTAKLVFTSCCSCPPLAAVAIGARKRPLLVEQIPPKTFAADAIVQLYRQRSMPRAASMERQNFGSRRQQFRQGRSDRPSLLARMGRNSACTGGRALDVAHDASLLEMVAFHLPASDNTKATVASTPDNAQSPDHANG